MKVPKFLQIAFLILLAAGAQPTYSAVYQWSSTAGNNATADPTINWSEGMAPSAVNDSARAMMAAIVVARRDWQGSAGVVAAGTASAITLSSNQGFSSKAAMDGQAITFLAPFANAAGATLNVDGLGAVPIVIDNLPTSIPAGTFSPGTPYTVTYFVGVNQFRLWNVFSNPYNVPLGALIAYTGTTAPNANFILPAGQCISTTTYAAYWALMGSPASGACPGGQFAVIDMRAKVPAAIDNLNGTAANLMTSSVTGCGTAFTTVGAVCANGDQSSTILTTNLPAYTPAGSVSVVSTVSNIIRGNIVSDIGTGGATSKAEATASQAITSTGSLTGTPQGGNSTAMPRVQPTIAVTYLLRVI